MMHKTFWECLEVQLKEDPPTYGHVIKLVAEIKEARQRWGGSVMSTVLVLSPSFISGLMWEFSSLEFRFCFIILNCVITEMPLYYMFMMTTPNHEGRI